MRALRLPGMRWVIAVHAADLALEYASSVALMVVVYDATSSPLAAAGMLVAKQIVPGALLASAGRHLDALPPATGLAGAYAIRAAAFVALAAVGTGPALYAMALVAGAAGVTSRVLIRATVARATHGPDFRAVTAVQNLAFGAMTLVGPAAGAGAAAILGAGPSLVAWAGVSAALVFAAAAMPAVLRRAPAAPSPAEAPASSGTQAPRHGLGETSRLLRAPVRSMLLLAAFLAVVFAMDEPALLAYVRDDLGASTGLYGGILTAWGVGVIVGGAAYSRFGLAAPLQAIVAGVSAAAVGYIGLGLAPSPTWACVAAVVGGVGNGSYWVALVTAVLERAPLGAEARVAGQLEGIATAMPAVGIVLGGAVAQFGDPRTTLWLPGVLALAALSVWVAAARRSTRPAPALPPLSEDPSVLAVNEALAALTGDGLVAAPAEVLA
jgi:hypothetical protein